jgi:hypothetical protein
LRAVRRARFLIVDLSSLASVDHLTVQSLAKELEDNGEFKVINKPATTKAPRAMKVKPRVAGQVEMLLPIEGRKGEVGAEAKPVKVSTSGRKAG